MPTYDYACDQCGPFESLRSIGQRDTLSVCPRCGTACKRVLTGAPRLAVISAQKHLAMRTNERASHEPVSSKSYVLRPHPSGCSCCSGGGKAKATTVVSNGNKSFPAKRPWMISH